MAEPPDVLVELVLQQVRQDGRAELRRDHALLVTRDWVARLQTAAATGGMRIAVFDDDAMVEIVDVEA